MDNETYVIRYLQGYPEWYCILESTLTLSKTQSDQIDVQLIHKHKIKGENNEVFT